MIGGRTRLIVLVVRVKLRQIDFVINQVTQRVFKATGKNLPLKANRQQLGLSIIEVFVSGQRRSPREKTSQEATNRDQTPSCRTNQGLFYSLNAIAKARGF